MHVRTEFGSGAERRAWGTLTKKIGKNDSRLCTKKVEIRGGGWTLAGPLHVSHSPNS